VVKVFLIKDGVWVNAYENENNWRGRAWADKLARKYFQLSTYPWLPVEPDPPRPELLERPRGALELPTEMIPGARPSPSPPPAWTILWTWRPWDWPWSPR
jgi:hypothetical protein